MMAAEGLKEKKIFTRGERGEKKFVSRGWSCPFPTPPLSNSKSDMIDWMNNHELIALAQANMICTAG